MSGRIIIAAGALLFAACIEADEPALGDEEQGIVNGQVVDGWDVKAIVTTRDLCSGTFISPNFVLTAAHCIRACASATEVGCRAGKVNPGPWAGRSGPYTDVVFDGVLGGTGMQYPVDAVYFPTLAHFDSVAGAPDVALLRTTVPFRGQYIPVMQAAEVPTPDNLCERYELTTPTIAGFSRNGDWDAPSLRRIGLAEVECDIEADGRAFKLDGHGRDFVGSRICPGDSGGPAMWRGRFGRYEVGGVNSFGDNWTGPLSNNQCPSDRGESGEAFVPRAFIDQYVPAFAEWAAQPGVTAVAGDFDGDGRDDVALTGGASWTTIPIGFSDGTGSFKITNAQVPAFPVWSRIAGARMLTGDVDGDGRDDLLLTGGAGWGTIPVAFSNGDGTFRISNVGVTAFPIWAASPNVQSVTGDFNGDGRTDLALTGGIGWSTVPVALSMGDGSFAVINAEVPAFPTWAQSPGARAVAGDFNGDRKSDIALTGPSGWTTIPIAFSLGSGAFSVTNHVVESFPAWAAVSGARTVVGDFNAEGGDDLLLTGPSGWTTLPMARSRGDGTFAVTNPSVPEFAGWASHSGVRVLAGNFAGNPFGNLALVGGYGWYTLPVLFAIFNSGGASYTNHGV